MGMKQITANHKTALIILALFIISLTLFLFNNTHEQLWYDETLVLHFSNMDWGRMIHGVGFSGEEAHPPLFHIIIKILRLAFGDSLFILRGFSALCGSFLIILVFSFTKRLFNIKVAFFSAALLITNPIIISLSQELRMYMLASLLVFVNLSYFYLALNEKKRKYWITYIISSVLGLYTHYYFVFTFFITFIYFCIFFIHNRYTIKKNKKTIIFYIIANIIPLCLFIPWLPAFFQQRVEMTFAYWMVDINPGLLYKLLGYFYASKFSGDINPFVPSLYISIFTLIFFIYGFFVKIRHKEITKKTIFFAISFIVPIIISFIYSVFVSNIVRYRYFVMYFSFFIILVAYGISYIPYKKISYLLLILLMITTVPNTYLIYTNKFNGNLKDVALSIKKQSTKNEIIITYLYTVFLPVYYYLGYYDKLYLYNYDVRRYPGTFGKHLRRETYLVEDEINKILKGHSSVWIIENKWEDKITKLILQKNTDYTIDPAKRIEIFAPKYSWQKVKLLHLIKIKK